MIMIIIGFTYEFRIVRGDKAASVLWSAVEYLKEKAQMEQSLRQEELAVTKKDQELQTQLQQQL